MAALVFFVAAEGGDSIPYVGLSPGTAAGVAGILFLFWRIQRSLVKDQAERIDSLQEDVANCDKRNNEMMVAIGKLQRRHLECGRRIDQLVRALERHDIDVPPARGFDEESP